MDKIRRLIIWLILAFMVILLWLYGRDRRHAAQAVEFEQKSAQLDPNIAETQKPLRIDPGRFGDNVRFLGVFRVSAYCSCELCTGKWADILVSSGRRRTASGHIIRPNDRFVAAPPEIPFNTMFIIEGYNDGKPVPVLDRGEAIKGRCLDIYFTDDEDGTCTGHQKALEWGVKYLPITIVGNKNE